MSRLPSFLKRLRDDDEGAALVEYAVIFAVLIAGTVTALGLIAPELVDIFTLIGTTLAAIAALVP